jgi:hypothetical protein
MKRLLITSVAVLGLSSAAFAQMITAPGSAHRNAEHRQVTRAVSASDMDDMTTGAIPSHGSGYHNGMYSTPMDNLKR